MHVHAIRNMGDRIIDGHQANTPYAPNGRPLLQHILMVVAVIGVDQAVKHWVMAAVGQSACQRPAEVVLND